VNKANSKTTRAAICVLYAVFNPAKFSSLLNIFGQMYLEELSPLPVLQAFLNIFTTGKTESKYGNFIEKDWDDRRSMISPVKRIFELFGIETILIWVAVLTKKRIFVYCDKLDDLQAIIRSLPLLGAWHRQNWDLLRPLVNLNETELADLKDTPVFIAGFTDESCANQKELFDLFIDVSSKSCTISESARGDFALAKFHKELITGFLKSAAEETDQAIIKTIALKTKDLLGNLETFKGDHPDGKYVTMDDLHGMKLPANMDRFLFNVALAEGWTSPQKS